MIVGVVVRHRWTLEHTSIRWIIRIRIGSRMAFVHTTMIVRVCKWVYAMINTLVGDIVCEQGCWTSGRACTIDWLGIEIVGALHHAYSLCAGGVEEPECVSPNWTHCHTCHSSLICIADWTDINTDGCVIISEGAWAASYLASECAGVSCIECCIGANWLTLASIGIPIIVSACMRWAY